MRVTLTRTIFAGGEALESGSTHDLAEDVASEIIRQGAANLATDPEPTPEPTPKKK